MAFKINNPQSSLAGMGATLQSLGIARPKQRTTVRVDGASCVRRCRSLKELTRRRLTGDSSQSD
jgi:hypothetical protein